MVEHSFIFRKMKMFCGLIHFLLVNMNCLCISTVIHPFETQERQKSFILLLSICKSGVCVSFPCCLDMANRFFLKNCCENQYMEREGLNSCACLLCLEICMWKRHLQTVFSKRRDNYLCGAK